jgi:hypothetical protein
MTYTIIEVFDLPSALQDVELIEDLVAGANAKAARVAPCLVETADSAASAEARLVLLGAIKRWVDAGAGALQQQTAGPFGVTVDTRQRTGYNFWPSEIRDLQDICRGADEKKAFSVDTVCTTGAHSPICAVYFGAADCSCGAVIAGYPIYETTD